MYIINEKNSKETKTLNIVSTYEEAKNILNKYIKELNCPQKIIKEKDSFKLLSTNGDSKLYYIQEEVKESQ